VFGESLCNRYAAERAKTSTKSQPFSLLAPATHRHPQRARLTRLSSPVILPPLMGASGSAHPSISPDNPNLDSKIDKPHQRQDPIVLVVILCFTVLLVWRMFAWTNQYAVDLLYMDQWDFYTPLFNHAGIAQLFTWRHGPHRQGVGMLVIAALANLTHWNVRADAFAVASGISLATLLALLLKRRLFGTLTWSDLLIPALLLTMRQWESLISVPNLSHSAMPLMLLMLYALAWTIQQPRLRYVLILILNFLALFTGFGFFLGLITPVLLLMEVVRTAKFQGYKSAIPAAIACALSILSFASFFIGYVFEPAAPDFRFPHPKSYLYPEMMALLFANGAGFVGTGPLPNIIGWSLFLSAIAVALIHTRALLSAAPDSNAPTDKVRAVIWILIAFSMLFAAGMAVGRISLGVQMGTVSRYVTLVLPALLGLYFHLLTKKPSRWRRVILIGATAMLAIFALHVRPHEEHAMTTYFNIKTRWREVYRQTQDIDRASRAAGTNVHPDPAKTHLQQKLDYLKQNHLSLFAD
jgi:hypothetical protein